nr:DegT/DnrJ/EryC1/StrS family aminotransferase [Candidatus Wallbacteria bacterium]
MIEYENLGKSNAVFFKEYEESFARTLQSGWYILGNNVDNFEREFADYCGVKHCRGLASGLDALILSLRALEIEPGCEVIVPSNTYIATIISIIQNGLKPVLVEPDIATY